MFEKESMLEEFSRDAKRYLSNSLPAKRWVVVGLTFFLIGSSVLYAQEVWQGPTPPAPPGSWFNRANWNPVSLPTATQNATVNNGGTAQIAALGQGGTVNILTIDGGSTVQLSPDLRPLPLGVNSLQVSTSIIIGTGGTLEFSGGTTNNGVNMGGTTNTAPVQDNGNWLFDGPFNHTKLSILTGSGKVTMAGTGTLTLGTTSTYGGATIISSGTLLAGSTTGLSPNSAFTVNSTLDLNGFNSTIGSLSGTGFVRNNGGVIATLTVGNDNTSTTFSGILQDGTSVLQLTKSGTGTLTLTGINTYTGITTINAGVLSISQDANLGTPPGTPVANQLTFNGGTLQATASFTLNPNRGVTTLNAGGTFDVTDANVLTIAGAITGPGSLTETGTGKLILAGVNTYTGITTLHGGVLSISQDANLGTAPGTPVPDQLTFNFGTLEATATFALNPNRGITLVGTNDTISVTGTNALTYGGVITGAGSLLKGDAGTLILSGVNTYTGITTINAGVLSISQDANLGTPPGTPVANQLTFNGGTLQATASFTLNPNRGVTLNAGGTFDVTVTNVLTIAGAITGPGSLTETGTGKLILAGVNTYTGITTLHGGVLSISQDANLGTAPGTPVPDQLTFNFGTLEATATFALNPNRGITLVGTNDTISVTGTNVLTYGGVITGAGSLLKGDAGTLILSGVNTYTGITTINAGVLSISQDANLGTPPGTPVANQLTFNGGTLQATASFTLNPNRGVTLNAGGTFGVTDANALTIAGAITGPGSLTKVDTGTLILSGVNTYTGITTINAGVLSISQDANLGTPPGTPVANQLTFNGGTLQATASFALNPNRGVTLNAGGTFDVTGANVLTIDGLITGPGSLTKVDTGNLILAGVNTYSGITAINAGVLSISQDANLGTPPGTPVGNQLTFNGGALRATASFTLNPNRGVTLNAGGTFDVTGANVLTYAGVITGPGNVTKVGTGTLTFSSTSKNTYTGPTTVNSGSLIVDGSIASSQTIVNPGGFLGGHGTVGSLVNSGIVGQINSPGTLTVAGNYTQNEGGILRIGVAGVATDRHDLLSVGGHATLGGTLQLIRLEGFNLNPGDQITFLTAKNGVNGTFSNAQNGLVSTGTILEAKVTSLANSVVFEAIQGSFANTPGVATTPNNAAVAKALDSAAGDPRAAALFAFLNSEPLANLPNDLTLIAPTQISSVNATAVSVSKVQISNLGQRLANIRGGSSGFSSSGFAISGGAASFGEGFAGVSGPEGKSGTSVFAPTPENRWGVFLTGLGEFTNVDSTPNAAGYNVDTGGFTFGVDYRLSPNFAIGLTGGYAHTSVNLDGGGNIDVNGGKIGLYATAFANGFYLDTAVSGGPSGYNTRRTALQGTASGSTDGADVNVLVAAGYDWKRGNLTIGPTASFQFSYVGLDGFTESGSLAPLKFPDQNTESERTAFGARASYDWKVSHITVIPQISAAWQHEYGATAYSVVASFANGAGNSFTVNGPEIGRDSLLVGAGATVIWNERVSTYLYYDGEVARTNYQSHNVSGGFRISF